MNRFALRAGWAVTVLAAGLACPAAVVAESNLGDDPAAPSLTFRLEVERPYAAPPGPWRGRTVALAQPASDKAGGATIPTFTRKVEARGRLYTYTMVGSDPFVKRAKKVVVPVLIIPVRFEYDDGTVFDPTLPDTECLDGRSVLSLVQESPVFQDADYGDGSRQYVEQFRRWEFWSQTGAPGALNPGYSVRVSTKVLPTVTVQVPGPPTTATHCGRMGILDIFDWLSFAQTKVLPQLRRQGVNAKTFPLFLFSNVGLVTGPQDSCCILGFHTAFSSAGIQTYGVAAFMGNGMFRSLPDVSVLAHEVAEWYDDPLINNATPPWGHTGQVSDCQNNLENGDPLTGRLHQVEMPNGFAYHPQELAFFSWFFNQVPSLGINGWYSNYGRFLEPAELCQ
jgi:hypothetical protein